MKVRAKGKKRVVYRSAKTGRVVTAQYAAAHPATTVRETVAGRSTRDHG